MWLMNLEDLVNQLRREYDYVLFDSPPIDTNTPDAGMIGRATGKALLVVRMNKTRRESVEGAIRELHGATVRVFGFLLRPGLSYFPVTMGHSNRRPGNPIYT